MTSYVRSVLRPASRLVLSPDEAPPDLASAYRSLKATLGARNDWAGWKLGGTNGATCAAFGVDRPYFGPLAAPEILVEPTLAPGFTLCEWKGEVEIALRIGADGVTHDAWSVALEMPASAIRNLPEAGVAALVADRCAAGALLLGPVRHGTLPDLTGARLSLCRGPEILSEAGIETLTAPPAALLTSFLAIAREAGFAPQPGDWVATGGITACCHFEEGDRITVRLDGSTELDVLVRCGPDA